MKRVPRNGRMPYILAAVAALLIVFLFTAFLYAQVTS